MAGVRVRACVCVRVCMPVQNNNTHTTHISHLLHTRTHTHTNTHTHTHTHTHTTHTHTLKSRDLITHKHTKHKLPLRSATAGAAVSLTIRDVCITSAFNSRGCIHTFLSISTRIEVFLVKSFGYVCYEGKEICGLCLL